VPAPRFDYLNWVKERYPTVRINLSGSGISAPSEATVPLAQAGRALEIPDTKGFQPLFARIARHLGVPEDRVLAVPGCTYAMHLAIRSTTGPGDDAVLESPTYELLQRVLEAHGARAVPVARRASAGFALAVDDVARALTPRTKSVLLTSPHNPSGRLLADDAVAGLARLAAERNVRVVVDEVYLDFHPRASRSYASLAAVSDRFVVAGSLTKAHGLSGLRLGWIAGPPDVIAEAWRWQEILADRVPALDAQAGCVAFDHMPAMQARAWAAYARGFPQLQAWAREQGLEVLDPGAGITALVKLPPGVDSLALSDALFEKERVLAPPGEMFGVPGWLRISWGVPDETLREGLRLVAAAIKTAAR
jgi:aspartate/methionine/tyrosine aminotransferase